MTYSRQIGTLLLILVALPSDGALAARSKGPTCAFKSAGGTLTTTVSLKHSPIGRNVTLAVSKSGSPNGQQITTTTLRRGHESVLRLTATIASSGALDGMAEFGSGFHGIKTMTFTSTNGQTFDGTVDGRALQPFSAGTAAGALRFADGRAAPKVKIKRTLQAVLRKLSQVNFQSCIAPVPASGSSVRPEDVGGDLCKTLFGSSFLMTLGLSDCDCCQLVCNVGFVGFGLGGIAGCAVTVIGCVIAEVGVFKGASDCYNACAGASECCPVPCAEGTPTQTCTRTCSENAVCCGGAGEPNGQCCDNAADCCGTTSPTCLEGIFTGYKCADAQTGAFCYPGQGDVCADTSMPGLYNGAGVLGSGSACCPADTPVCRDATNHVCCSSGAGDVCGNGCCQTSTPHCDDFGSCCLPTDTCGPTGQCCPNPHVCLGSQCCNPPLQVCASALTGGTTCCQGSESCNNLTGACCPALTTVRCGVATSSTPNVPAGCCNNETEACIGSGLGAKCCPRARACGSVCCAEGQFCEDASQGTCGTCMAGLTPVTCNNNGTPSTDTCCAANTLCCSGQCCPFASDQYGQVVCCSPVAGDVPPFANGQFGCHHLFVCAQ